MVSAFFIPIDEFIKHSNFLLTIYAISHALLTITNIRRQNKSQLLLYKIWISCLNKDVPNENLPTPRINLFATISYWLLLITVVVIPMAILPIFDNFIQTTKVLLLMVMAIATFGIFVIRAAQKGRIQLPISPLVGSLSLFGLAILASSIFSAKYPVRNLLGMGGVYLAMVIMAILGGALLPKKKSGGLIHALNFSGILISLTTFLQAVGFGPSRILNSLLPLQIPNDMSFNLTGSPFIAVQMLAITIIGIVVWMISNKRFSKLLLGSLIINIVGFAINLWLVLPGKIGAPLLLPFTASWPIALDVLRTPRPALIGVGPDNYGVAYSVFKPAWTNVTTWWNVQFTQGSNAPLTILTTAGLFGLISWILVLWALFKQVKVNRKQSEVFAVASIALAILVMQLFFAPNIVMLSLLGVVLAFLIAATRKKLLNIQTFAMNVTSSDLLAQDHSQPKIARYLGGAIGLVLTAVLFYGVARAHAASYMVFKSLLAMQGNNAVQVYELQQKATQLNPYMDSYRRRYAQTNIQIAAALSNKADITADEQNQVAQLIQQAIREARAATLLNQDDSQNWSILAQIYRNLIGTAQDAPEWAVSAYVKAVETAPTDPNLRIELGGIFFNQQDYNQALTLFQQAADLKPDLPNAYYNAANTLKVAGQFDQAKLAYQRTLLLLEPDSEGYIQASKELEEVEAKLKENEGKKVTQQKQDQIPSILNQNVNQNETSVVNQPSSQQLDNATQQELGAEQQGQFNPEQ